VGQSGRLIRLVPFVPGKRYGLAQRSSPISPVAVVADTITKLVRFQSQPVALSDYVLSHCVQALYLRGDFIRGAE
jgi:hypothetical protein